jgi:hypothetical protein
VALLGPRLEVAFADFESLSCGSVWSDSAIPRHRETQAQAHRHGLVFDRAGSVAAVDGEPVSRQSQDHPSAHDHASAKHHARDQDEQGAVDWEHPCTSKNEDQDGETSPRMRLCESVLLRQLVSAKAWSPHEQVGYECDPMG